MKVLHVIGPLKVGGAQTQLLGLIQAGHGHLWDASVCATSSGVLSQAFASLGVPYAELPRWGSPGLLRTARLRRLVATGGFDVVHSNLWQSNAMARAAVMGRHRRPAVVISERNVERQRARSKLVLDQFLAHWTDLWVANSDAVAEFTHRVHPCRPEQVVTIVNAVDRSVFFPMSGAGSGPLHVGAVGRLDDEKGFDVLVESVRVLRGRGVDVRASIAGVGPLAAALRDQAAGLPVDFVGALEPGPQVADFLRGLAAFVLPSRFREGRANVILEALACGVPVIATDIPGAGELLDGGGVVVPAEDAAALADAIQAVGADLAAARARAKEAGSRLPTFDDLAVAYAGAFKRAIDLRDSRR